MERLSDEELVALSLQGQTEAFSVLVNRYNKQVFNLAYRLSGNYEEANDCSQEAFLRIYQNLAKYDSNRSFFSWMYKVSYNTCLNTINKRPKEMVPLGDVLYLSDDDSIDNAPALSYEQKETRETIRTAILELPEKYRIPIFLQYMENFSYQEIAEHMGVPVSTIETRLFRGKKKLQEKLADLAGRR